MSQVKHILVATDGSALSLKAAAYAGDLARALGAAVSVVMVCDEGTVVPEAWGAFGLAAAEGPVPASTEDVRTRIEQRALVDELTDCANAVGELAAEPTKAVLWGRVADQVCDYARQYGVDMIVMGSHGRAGLKRALLGSVSHAVANQAPCAVTIVR
jgi:nucleotide-binding universal stress UspA family protein